MSLGSGIAVASVCALIGFIAWVCPMSAYVFAIGGVAVTGFWVLR